jgi:hypothetical protein
MRKAPRSRLAGVGFKPPKAAVAKSHGSEHLGKVTAQTVAGENQGDERKRTTERCRNSIVVSKPEFILVRISTEEAAYGRAASGIRCMTLIQALRGT